MKNIIVVDMQKGFINDNNKFLIDKIEEYLKNNNFDNVFFTRYVNHINSPFVKLLNWNGMIDKKEQEFAINFDNYNNASIFTKTGYGLSENIIKTLKEKNISEIEIVGTDIDACVLCIAFNLFDNNIKPIIIKDLCGSSSSKTEIIKSALAVMERQFGKENII